MMDEVTQQMQANLTMFSADFAMNLQVLTFMNTLTLVEYQTRAFKDTGNQLGNLNIVSAADGFFKLVTEHNEIWTLNWTMDFGTAVNGVKVYAILNNQSKPEGSIINIDGKRVTTQAIDFKLEIDVTGGDDAKNLATQVMTWVMVRLGIIKEN